MQLILAFLASVTIRLLRLTWRVRLLGPSPYDETDRPLVFCFWHGRQAGLFAHPRRKPIAVLSSLSRDGSLQARILRLLGFVVLRGSSSRGGAAGLKALVGEVRRGRDAAFAVDGPRGPAFEVKPGAVLAARETDGSLIPITTRASSFWRFSTTWDDYQLPKPFARVEIERGRPIPVSDSGAEPLRHKLEQTLRALDKAAV
ncbi:MAG: lysophospholipid acyltransferase family protein [Deltaproteobacteria bacterium]|nr:lysophospholipid acyltransferase family protein [Deltaproteobacteria bacterium]